ncbi:MAG: hypothetical protein U0166_14465 [Acidobacteriota bacterium]
MKKRLIVALTAMSFVFAITIVTAHVTKAANGGTTKLRASAHSPYPTVVLPRVLPKVPKRPMFRTRNYNQRSHRAQSTLQFDDGSCESGLGAASDASSLTEFDVPPQCTQPGLDIIRITSRMNTYNAQQFVLHQGGGTPNPIFNPDFSVAITMNALGACPQTTLNQVNIGPGAAIVNGTTGFFAGMRNTGYVGRDSNGTPAGRIWFLCSVCGMTAYSPAALSGLGLGGNWMIRLTVEDAGCVPVELMHFGVE